MERRSSPAPAPNGPPPSYEESAASGVNPVNQSSTGNTSTSSSSYQHTTASQATGSSNNPYLQVSNGISTQSRRSMEDESRPLPPGWIRQLDGKTQHQFFVDTTVNPPRSIWQHPYDDETYMSSLPAGQRSKLEELHRVPSEADIIAGHSDEEDHHGPYTTPDLPPRPQKRNQGGETRSFGRRMKDKLTNTTHEEREQMRAERAKEEQAMYERHQRYRAAMARAAQTGEPQLIGKDRDGKDVYITPPQAGYPGQYNGYGYGYDPYAQGPYGRPNARYMRPADPYHRPYYGGYGGGLGLPLGAGLLGGALLGSALF